VGAENPVTLRDLRIFVDQAAELVPAHNPDVRAQIRWMRTPCWRTLAQCPVRPVRVVVIDILTEDQPQVPLVGDQHPVQALAAALAIHRSAIAFARGARTGVLMIRTDEELETVRVIARFIRRLRACWVTHSPVGFAVIPARCTRRVPCSMKNSTYRRRRNTVSTWKKSVARIVFAWASRNARHDCPDRLGAGSMPASLRICQTVDGASLSAQAGQLAVDAPVAPAGLSRAISSTSDRTDAAVRGRPGERCG
jgi:hypothetical protein